MNWADVKWSLKQATAPAVEPILYAEAKLFLRLANDVDQTYVESLIVAARQRVENDCGLGLIDQAFDMTLDAFPDDAIFVPVRPLASVTSIKTTTVAGVESTLAASNYQVDISANPPRIMRSDAGAWPGDIRLHSGIVIRLAVGYGDGGNHVPQLLIHAMQYLIRGWYAPRGTEVVALPPKWIGYDSNIAAYRTTGLA